MKLRGTYTALITPFINEEIDEDGLIFNLHRQIQAGISGFVLLGCTGEAATLSLKERERLVEIAVREVKGKVPLIVGTGFNCTRSTIEFSKKAEDLGADAVMVIGPYYNKPTQEGIFKHFQAVASSISIPILIYNNPSRTIINIETPTLKRISECGNIIGVKESSGNINQVADIIDQISSPSFTVLTGDDSNILPHVAMGADGVVSVVSNLVPEKIIQLVNAALENKVEEARALYYALLPLFKAAFFEVNPVPIKAAMNFLKIPAGGQRLPLCAMGADNHQKLQTVLQQMQLL